MYFQDQESSKQIAQLFISLYVLAVNVISSLFA